MSPRRMRMGNGKGFTMENFIVLPFTRVIKSRRFRWAGYVVKRKVRVLSKF